MTKSLTVDKNTPVTFTLMQFIEIPMQSIGQLERMIQKLCVVYDAKMVGIFLPKL